MSKYGYVLYGYSGVGTMYRTYKEYFDDYPEADTKKNEIVEGLSKDGIRKYCIMVKSRQFYKEVPWEVRQ